ncbi:hypothetical protein GQ53DRAFT_136716 [Thozetella sp. PMI_491]|nr:hypothetical protein GQ53DRAFT_136716 [Thozetella sp. PMI_491]
MAQDLNGVAEGDIGYTALLRHNDFDRAFCDQLVALRSRSNTVRQGRIAKRSKREPQPPTQAALQASKEREPQPPIQAALRTKVVELGSRDAGSSVLVCEIEITPLADLAVKSS